MVLCLICGCVNLRHVSLFAVFVWFVVCHHVSKGQEAIGGSERQVASPLQKLRFPFFGDLFQVASISLSGTSKSGSFNGHHQ